MSDMFFGKKVKELRLKYAKKGLRQFSIDMGMKPSEYFNIEKGYSPPPEDDAWLHKLCKNLEIPSHSEDELDLYAEWTKPFTMRFMDEEAFAVHGLMTDGTSADVNKLQELSEYMQDIAKEHNKKAKEYNESRREDSSNS